MGIQIPALPDSNSEVTLLHQSCFDKQLKPVVSQSSEEKGEAHSLSRVTNANDGQLPINMYLELDINLLV